MSAQPDELRVPGGLTDAQVAERIARGQANRTRSRPSRTLRQIVAVHVYTPFNALLGALWLLVIAVGTWKDALFGGVIVVNAAIGIAQELRAKRTLDRLALQSVARARVLRAGGMVDLAPEDIVQDDLLDLGAGDPVPVDCTVLDATDLELDESLLSGEADAVPRRAGDTLRSGSLVVGGRARCRATAVGEAAWIQGLQRQARRFNLAHSELRAGIDRILRLVGWALLPTATLLFVTQFALGLPAGAALLYGAAGVVAMVPQGLVLLSSLALAVGAVRLSRRHALVQNLAATEALARVDVICLDKTGTLTERDLRVARIEMLAQEPSALTALAALAAAEPRPNATLQAIAQRWPAQRGAPAVVRSVAFSSARKWSGGVLEGLGTWLLGAPDVLLAKHGSVDSAHPVLAQTTQWASEGFRVLLLARAAGEPDESHPPMEVRLVALILLSEQIRADARSTLSDLAGQGVAVRLISGDHPATVGGVARELGIGDAAQVVDASGLSDAELAARVPAHSVFARTSPRQKELIVGVLQSAGHPVAMVGDGVNDIPALKRADVGVAMGAGTPASRAVAQLVLLDNRFAGMPAVMAEGRRVVGNIERVAVLFLTKSVYAMLLALAVGVAGVAFPFLPRNISLVDALTLGIPAFLLSLEPNGQRLRPGFVERVLRFAIPAGLFVAAAAFAAFALVRVQGGGALPQARSAATLVLFATALWVLALAAAPLHARRAWLVAAMALAFLPTLLVPQLREFFALRSLSGAAWLQCAAIGAAAMVALHWSRAVALSMPERRARNRRWNGHELLRWLVGADSPKVFLAVSALLVVGGAWLFFGVLEDVLSHDPLVLVDVQVFHLAQALRGPTTDHLMVGITELGDAAVLLPLIVATLAWFVARRLWLSAAYWVGAVGVAQLLAQVIKLALHRPRPMPLYAGAQAFSFPSDHAVMSAVVYGMLAWLLLRRASPRWQRVGGAAAMTLVLLIGLSRVYLGAHWLSDVLGGLAFGVGWVALAAMAYTYHCRERLQERWLAMLLLGIFMAAAVVHGVLDHRRDMQRYAPSAVPTSRPFARDSI
ncbi:HAD-IC family P-type ATPase [Thiomonas sp. FB-6]|uniref:HAD-IC family P-type ATPase n=1 Tax=Thiomonas sp. FB-6 TaxID=1158291 RepID=UPI0018C95F03|nr:HAD-IC family P-type ATPase [Thiomonas sp. FB-6]